MAVYTLSMSLGAAAGFTGVAIPQVPSSFAADTFENHHLYHNMQLKQKEEEGGFELTVAQVSWLGQFYIFATQMQKNVSKHIFS